MLGVHKKRPKDQPTVARLLGQGQPVMSDGRAVAEEQTSTEEQ